MYVHVCIIFFRCISFFDFVRLFLDYSESPHYIFIFFLLVLFQMFLASVLSWQLHGADRKQIPHLSSLARLVALFC